MQEIIKSDDTEVQELKLLINNIDINKVVVSNTFPLGKQYF